MKQWTWQPGMRYDALGFSDSPGAGDIGNNGWSYNPSADISGGEAYQMTPELMQFLSQGGYQPVQYLGPNNMTFYAIQDRNGQIVPGTEQGTKDDRGFMNAALLAGAVVGGAAAGLGSGGGAAAGGIAEGAAAGGLQGGAMGATGGMTAGQAAAVGGAGALGNAGGSMGGDAVTVGSQSNPYGDYVLNSGTKTAGGGGSTSLADFFSGNGSASDYGRLAQTLYGLYAQNKATDAAAGGQAAANALMREMWQASQAENKPLVDMRNSVLPKINALLSNPSSVTQDPGYQFGLQQGQNQIDNSAAARGGYYSGAQMKASQKFGQDYAGTKLNDSLNRLMGVAGMGQLASSQNQQANNALAGGLGRGLAEMGNIRGSGYLGQAGTVNNAMNNWFADNWFKQGGG